MQQEDLLDPLAVCTCHKEVHHQQCLLKELHEDRTALQEGKQPCDK
jgi:hypothetical protein